eukprot:Nitzschia sp. Nitz4//scaffold28_size193895//167637//168533//NITZ4_PGAM//-1//CDS//3329546075//6891//frame0
MWEHSQLPVDEEKQRTIPESCSYEPWKVFPMSRFDELSAQFGAHAVKRVHLLRHAQGTHNVNDDYYMLDAPLTSLGKQQCQQLAGREQPLLHTPESACVVTSPLSRCVETAQLSLQHYNASHDIPFVAVEDWRESVNFPADQRRPIPQIQQQFPFLQTHHLKDDAVDHPTGDSIDPLWHDYRQRFGSDWDRHMESGELYRMATVRGVRALQALQARPESELVVSTHSAFLRCLLNWGHDEQVPMEPLQYPLYSTGGERLDTRSRQPLLEYSHANDAEFEAYMRAGFDNCEWRSFCLLLQ